MRARLIALLLAAPMALAAQTTGTISPNMNQRQVVAALGQPATVRKVGEHTYLFYRNNCGRACGMNDLVVLRSDSVVDAIFRSPSRHYTGKSSSPEPLTRNAARRRTAEPAAVKPAATRPAAQQQPPAPLKPAPATDTKPSIPVTKQPVLPAPTPSTRKPTS